MNINWYPGHMAKAKRQLAEKLKLIDLVIEVADARAPHSTLNPDFDDLFASKKRLLVLNKSDLADEKATKDWLRFFASAGRTACAFSCVTDKNETLLRSISSSVTDIKEKYAAKGAKKTIRALVAGIPNVGKSAILNCLAGGRKAKEGNMPGVTRGLQWVAVDAYLEIMDSPGLMWPKVSDEKVGIVIAALGSIKEEILDTERLSMKLIELLFERSPEALFKRYGVDYGGDALAVLKGICRRRGFLLKGGECDCERGAKTLLDEFQTGKLGRITLEVPDERP